MDHAPTTHDSKALLHAIFVVSVPAMYVGVTLFFDSTHNRYYNNDTITYFAGPKCFLESEFQ